VSTYRRAAVALAGEDAVRTTAEAFDAGGRAAAAAVFPDAIVDALLATGTPEQIAARVGLLAEAGCAGVRFTPVTEHPEDLGENLRVVELLGAVVDLLGPRGD
jgi:alkanesulfonate monooxygenase SsuD/methylene tetrahydromethanopterin reductase-like flavin-dependent oxidoreductase (luciferase family)